MCGTCGCADDGVTGHGHSHAHEVVTLEQKVLARNDSLAEENRAWLASRDIVALNLMSSPGSGKTTLLEHTLRTVGGAVIEGDQSTSFDADRIRATGADAIQINTGAGCHLDAAMVSRALSTVDPAPGSVVFIENVGNLVCPALFDLGETARVVVMSTPEGADKPAKYPHMFRTADVVVLNKTDLLPYLDFDLPRFLDSVRAQSPAARIFQVSATRGDGMPEWLDWLKEVAAGLSP